MDIYSLFLLISRSEEEREGAMRELTSIVPCERSRERRVSSQPDATAGEPLTKPSKYLLRSYPVRIELEAIS